MNASEVPADLVAAAVAEARGRGRDVADVPLTAIAAAAGVSRSTLLRRIGGSRRALDDAVRASGVDPGGRPPVRERAIEAAGWLIGEHGLATFTLEAVADAAECSLPSLYAVFEGRDGLLSAVFERYTPLLEVERLMAEHHDDLEERVRGVYRAFVAGFTREPRVLPAVIADLLSRPDGPGGRLLGLSFPRILASVGTRISADVRAGRIKPLPLPLLGHLLLGPLLIHLLSRPALASVLGPDMPSIDEACDTFTEAFMRAVALPGAAEGGTADV